MNEDKNQLLTRVIEFFRFLLEHFNKNESIALLITLLVFFQFLDCVLFIFLEKLLLWIIITAILVVGLFFFLWRGKREAGEKHTKTDYSVGEALWSIIWQVFNQSPALSDYGFEQVPKSELYLSDRTLTVSLLRTTEKTDKLLYFFEIESNEITNIESWNTFRGFFIDANSPYQGSDRLQVVIICNCTYVPSEIVNELYVFKKEKRHSPSRIFFSSSDINFIRTERLDIIGNMFVDRLAWQPEESKEEAAINAIAAF